MKTYPHSSQRIFEIVKTRKVLADGERVRWEKRGERGLQMDVNLEAPEAPIASLQLFVTSNDAERVTTYDANLILDGSRVRGVGHNDTARKRYYKIAVPKGWHQNIDDPNLRGWDRKRHEPLDTFDPSDLEDFLERVCEMWNIDLGTEQRLI